MLNRIVADDEVNLVTTGTDEQVLKANASFANEVDIGRLHVKQDAYKDLGVVQNLKINSSYATLYLLNVVR